MKYCAGRVAVICCIIVFVLTGCSQWPWHIYTEASSLMESGDYEAAMKLFLKIPNYEDSSSRVSECQYYLGIEAMGSEDWETAISCFTGLEFENSEELLDECITEQGMTEHADYDFLEDMEHAITLRSLANLLWSDDYTLDDLSELVEKELYYLEEYSEAEFYDSDLESIAERYLLGLYLQQDALDLNYEWDIQITWQRGKVYRYQALSDLYEDYGFLADDDDFVDTYVSQLEYERTVLGMYKAIQNDLANQMEADDFGFYSDPDTGYTYFTAFVNNTVYTYSIVFYVRVLDSNYTEIEGYYQSADSVKPGSSFQLAFNIEDTDKFCYIDLQHYFMSV